VCDYSEAQVDGWATPDGTMQHASRFTTTWESKCGSNIRISHVRVQLGNNPIPGSIYGDIVVSFRAATTAIAPTAIEIGGEAEAEHVAKIDSVVEPLRASFSLAGQFDVAFEAWKDTWFSPAMRNKQRYCFGLFRAMRGL
jgi:hypothetical protein